MTPSDWNIIRIAASVLSFFIGITFAFASHHVISIAFVSIGILFLFVDYAHAMAANLRRMLKSEGSISVRQTGNSISGTVFRTVMKKSFFKRLDHDIRDTVLSGTVQSGHLENPLTVSRRVIMIFVFSIIPSSLIAVSGIIVLESPLFAAVMLVPFLILLYPKISRKMQSADSSSGYDRDLAYFLSYLHITHISKTGIYQSMTDLIDRRIFPAVEKDARMLLRWVEFDGMPEIDAINKLANSHANKVFQTFLFAYFDLSVSNPNNLDTFISHAASNEFEKAVNAEKKALDDASGIFVMGGLAMIMVPVLLVIMSFAVPDADIIGLVGLVVMVLPLLFTCFVIGGYRKKNDVDLRWSRLSMLGLIAIIPCYIMTSDMLTSLSLGIAITCLMNGNHVSRQISYTRSAVNGFPIFLRDFIEKHKTNPNFIVSLKKIFEYDLEKKYGRFSDVIDDIRTDMHVIPFEKQDVFFNSDIRSERLRMMMFVLQSIFDGGYKTTISSLERLHSFSVDVIKIKNQIDSTLRVSSVMLLVSPLIFFVTLSALSTIMLSFTEYMPDIPKGLDVDSDALKYFERFDISSILSAMSPAVFVMSICSGIIVSRVAYSSFVATTPMGICMSVAFVIFLMWDLFFDAIAAMMI